MKVAFLLLSIAYRAFAFPKQCPNVTVIHDVKGDGWKGGCVGLTKQPKLTTAAACEEGCKTDVNCSIWQMTKENCWTTSDNGNVVHGCRSDTSANGNEEVLAGQRLQHGFVNVVKLMIQLNIKTWTIGLMPYPAATGTQAEKIDRCKMMCYSDVTCNVWQFGSDGCQVEHYTSPAKSTTTESAAAKAMIAGETIAHTCPPYVKEEELPAWCLGKGGFLFGCMGEELGLLGLLGLLALGLLAFFLCQKTPKVKKTRAVKIEPRASGKASPPPVHEDPSSEEEEKVYFVPHKPIY